MSIDFLRKGRFNPNANDVFFMNADDYAIMDPAAEGFINQLDRFINRHKSSQVNRLKALKRYYLADNDIRYKEPKSDKTAADNRIASDFARYITIFEQSYMLGKPVVYKNASDKTLQEEVDDFSKQNNESYHNVLIKTDLSIYGRAYELLYVDGDENNVQVRLARLNPEQVFVVYDDTVQRNSLFAVRYYRVRYEEGKFRDFVEVYTNDKVYYYRNDNQEAGGMKFVEETNHEFDGVPVTEYASNEDRTGAYEAVLDTIDAYDLAQSELANTQEDFNNALLMIKGNPFTGSDENPVMVDDNGTERPNPNFIGNVVASMKQARLLIMDDNPDENGAEPGAEYLTKTYDSAGTKAYIDRLVGDILRFTFTPDTSDQNFSGVQSGEAMKYKLMAADNRRVTQERLFERGLMRRLRLAVNVWRIKGNSSVNYDAINDTEILFTPNIPQNVNELIANVKSLYGIVSDETLLELLKQFTGVDADEELKRLEKQKADNQLMFNGQTNDYTNPDQEGVSEDGDE